MKLKKLLTKLKKLLMKLEKLFAKLQKLLAKLQKRPFNFQNLHYHSYFLGLKFELFIFSNFKHFPVPNLIV